MPKAPDELTGVKSPISWIKSYAPILLPAAFLGVSLLGFLYDMQVYGNFGINIVGFAEPEDFFFGWARDLYAISYAATVILIVVAGHTGFWVSRQYLSQKKTLCRLGVPISLALFIIPLFLFGGISKVEAAIVGSPQRIILFGGYAGLAFFLMGISYGGKESDTSKKRDIIIGISFKITFLILLATMLIFGLFMAMSTSADLFCTRITNGEAPRYLVHLKQGEKSPVVTGPYSLIGSTSSYHFFYSYSSKSVFAVPINNISIIEQLSKESESMAGKTSAQEDPNLENGSCP